MRAERPILLRFLKVLTKNCVFIFSQIYSQWDFKVLKRGIAQLLLSMKETCQNLVRSVVQREDLQIQKENSGKENRMLNLSRIWIGFITYFEVNNIHLRYR
jgi:hypothetical protein